MIRTYICDNCEYEFSISQKMHDPLKKICPQCRKHKLYQDLTDQHTFVYQDPKTLGHQAERNTERMGKYDLEDRRKRDSKVNEQKRDKKKSWYNKEGKDLSSELSSLNTTEKKHKYIMEGK